MLLAKPCFFSAAAENLEAENEEIEMANSSMS